jgi:hypothetical protein
MSHRLEHGFALLLAGFELQVCKQKLDGDRDVLLTPSTLWWGTHRVIVKHNRYPAATVASTLGGHREPGSGSALTI